MGRGWEGQICRTTYCHYGWYIISRTVWYANAQFHSLVKCSCRFIAIQLARLSGFSPIITTASLHNAELLSSLGATHVLDRRLSTAALKDAVAKITSAPITLAFDAISLLDTQQSALDILTGGGTLIIVSARMVESKG